jgi:anti-sigma factor RsiW
MFAEMKPKIKRKLIVTRADHPRALEVEKIQSLATQAEVPSPRRWRPLRPRWRGRWNYPQKMVVLSSPLGACSSRRKS